jgi:DNA polymerase phi
MKINNLVRTPEAVAVWLEAKSCYSDAALPKDVWKHRDPLYRDETASLSEIMKDARAKQQPTFEETIAAQGAGNWSQQLHFSWDVLLRELYLPALGDTQVSAKRMTFANFWAAVVDSQWSHYSTPCDEKLTILESLFLPSSSPERKHSGFLLLGKVVATVPAEYLKEAFTTNTVLILATHLKVDERYLHRVAKKAVQALQDRASREPNIVLYAIQGLVLGPSGQYNFDATTKTKTVAKLLTTADLSTIRDLVSAVRDAMERPQALDGKQADVKRRAFADILVSICTRSMILMNKETDTSNSVAELVLDALIGLAYSNKPFRSNATVFEPIPSPECRAYLRSRIRTCLDQSLQHPATRSDLLRHTILSLQAVQGQEGGDHTIVDFDEETHEIVQRAWKSLRKISKTVGEVIERCYTWC